MVVQQFTWEVPSCCTLIPGLWDVPLFWCVTDFVRCNILDRLRFRYYTRLLIKSRASKASGRCVIKHCPLFPFSSFCLFPISLFTSPFLPFPYTPFLIIPLNNIYIYHSFFQCVPFSHWLLSPFIPFLPFLIYPFPLFFLPLSPFSISFSSISLFAKSL